MAEQEPRQRWEALYRRMREGLATRAKHMEEALARIQNGELEAFEALRREAHRLRGTAPSYGMLEIGEKAGELEEAIRSGKQALIDALTHALLSAIREELARDGGGEALSPPNFSPRWSLLEGRSVLAAEDDEATRRLLELALLNMAKMKGQILRDGLELIEVMEKQAWVDLLVIDAMMPKMNGIDALNVLLQRGWIARVGCVVVLSAASLEEGGWSIPSEICFSWYRKPFRPSGFLDLLASKAQSKLKASPSSPPVAP
ncbi:MAG: response regulator [Deltaproteobacteria bacterium]|nr:response regulator [Deltaproteobacteria bacterium]